MGEAKRRLKSGATVRKINDSEMTDIITRMANGETCEYEELQADLGLLLMMHFPDAKGISEDEDLQCEKCMDLLTGVCPGRGLIGSAVVIDCFSKKIGKEIFFNC
jgi:hypothetical protein